MNAPDPAPLCGLLIIDKPYRLSSMSICRVIRGKLVAGGAPKRVKVGHAGTLDPLASGVLVILIGRATRLCDTIMAGAKRYEAEIDLSRLSTTQDLEGELTDVPVAEPPTRADLEHACAGFVGEIMQAPPAHSAVWIDGRRAYDLARSGRVVEPAKRPVRIDSIEIIAYEWPLATLDIRCGKGTYIRSLARDLGASIGVGGMLTALRRTASAPFTIDDAVRLDDVPDPLGRDDLRPVPAL